MAKITDEFKRLNQQVLRLKLKIVKLKNQIREQQDQTAKAHRIVKIATDIADEFKEGEWCDSIKKQYRNF